MKRFYVLFSLLLALAVVIRISAITTFAVTLSYVLAIVSLVGLIVTGLFRKQFREK